MKNKYIFICLLFLLLSGSISTIIGYIMYNVHYRSDISLSQTGLQHMQKAETLLAAWSHSPLETGLIGQAEAEFSSAFNALNLLNSDLQSLPQFVIKPIPSYGAKLDTALRLVPLAMTLSQMGISGCRILNTLMTGLQNPFASQSQGLTASALASMAPDVKGLKSSLALATHQINQLQSSDMQFDTRIPRLVSAFSRGVPIIQKWADNFEQLVSALLGIGTPANYLVEVLDSTELRPGGGFIGNYGIATLSNGRLMSAQITDVMLLDRPFVDAGHIIPYPAAYSWFNLAPQSWSLRDSNLDADFPTAARYSEEIYHQEGGSVSIQGVIAITPVLVEQVLMITGPIAVPEYQETVTAQNLFDRIHHYQLGGTAVGQGSSFIPSPDGYSSTRKRFTAFLAEHLLTRVRQLPSSDLAKLFLLMTNSVRSKDIQLYFNSGIAEDSLHHLQLDGGIQAPVGDGLFVVDANISGNKANSFITTTVNDSVTINSQGDAIHHATLQYAWTTSGNIYGSGLYRDYVRVYVPSGSTLLSQEGWQVPAIGTAFNRSVWMGLFTMSYGETHTLTLVWKVPQVASKDHSSWHYQYSIQRQAGILWKMKLQVTLPQCAATTGKWEGLVSSGKQNASFAQSLTQDMHVGVDYACK